MDQKKIGAFIAACRKEKGMTQQQLADRLGITNKSVSKWENDRVVKIAPEVFKAYSDISGFTMDYLQGFVDDPKETTADKALDRMGSKVARSYEFINLVSK